MDCYHITKRDRAIQILAHGFDEQDVFPLTSECVGVRFMRSPTIDEVPLRFKVTAVDGVPTDWLPDVDMDPREWEPLPLGRLHDPIGRTAIQVTTDADIKEYRCLEAVSLRNRQTGETRATEHLLWTGEWLVPLALARAASVKLLERRLDDDEEKMLKEQLHHWREHWRTGGTPEHEIERRLRLIEEDVRFPWDI